MIHFFYSVNEILHIVLKKSLGEKLEATCGVNCTISDMCKQCRIKKGNFCKNNHLVNSSKWFEIISRKFGKCEIVRLVDDIATYSGFDFEMLLRELYEKVYRNIFDSGHNFWKKKITRKSITHNKPTVSDNYWNNLIYMILELKCEENNITINKYDLPIKTNKIVYKNVFLDSLGIHYDYNKLTILENHRNINFGSSTAEIW